MDGEKMDKIVIITTRGPEDPERATLPFVIANAALAMDTKAIVILQATAVTLALEATHRHVYAPGFAPLADLVKSFQAQGGELLVCTPCIKERHITTDMLVAGAKPVAAARVVQECLEAKATLNY